MGFQENVTAFVSTTRGRVAAGVAVAVVLGAGGGLAVLVGGHHTTNGQVSQVSGSPSPGASASASAAAAGTPSPGASAGTTPGSSTGGEARGGRRDLGGEWRRGRERSRHHELRLHLLPPPTSTAGRPTPRDHAHHDQPLHARGHLAGRGFQRDHHRPAGLLEDAERPRRVIGRQVNFQIMDDAYTAQGRSKRSVSARPPTPSS